MTFDWSYGVLNVSAGDGEAGHASGGGGGSGGSVLVSTGGTIKVEGNLRAVVTMLANDDLASSRAVGRLISASGYDGFSWRWRRKWTYRIFAQSADDTTGTVDFAGGRCRAWSKSFVRDVELELGQQYRNTDEKMFLFR